MKINETLQEREKNYGDFAETAGAAHDIKGAIAAWEKSNLSPPQKEALDMIAVKIARIITGNPDYADNWHDIAGYATLVEQYINNQSSKQS